MALFWLLIGAGAGVLLGIAATAWLTRRSRQGAGRIAGGGAEQLVELGQLAGGLAHEIKNPLSTININLKLLSEDLARRNDEDHRRWLRRLAGVQEETARLRGILDDFLRFAGKVELTLETADLRRLVGEVTDFFAPQVDAAGVVMRTAMPDAPVLCRIDVDLVKQALLNLLINAVQAMADGGELLIRLSGQRGEAEIEVTDTGTGIPPEELDSIFQAYYSTKKHGTGLGLPTTRRIIREHGGAVRLESEPGKGTRFVISLPLCDA